MNILFLGYWGANEGLSQATILPHLSILSDFDNVSTIIYCSIERYGDKTFNIGINKVTHVPLFSTPSKIPLADKVNDFIQFPKQIIELCQTNAIDKIICRGAPAGAIGYLVWKKTNINYFVESYEPHAQYMLESKIWRKYDPRYLFQRYWEKKQNQTATALMPVANNYKNYLITKGIPENKIDVIPCCVDSSIFQRNNSLRKDVRQQLKIDSAAATVFIYVGKFGGLYVEKEAFLCFKEILSNNQLNHIIILTPSNKENINLLISENNLPSSSFTLTECKHTEVANYLSASDVALALYKQGESKQFLSPIKIGEYWACGLPVLMPAGIGDETSIIQQEGGGSIFQEYSSKEICKAITNISIDPEKTRTLAHKYRSFDHVIEVYKKWYSN